MRISTIDAAKAALNDGQVLAEELVLQSHDALLEHGRLGAIAEFGLEQALETARKCDKERATGIGRGALHGIPVTVKDLFEVPSFSTKAGTRARLAPLGKSTAVARLQDAGAIVIAKTNMHEIALGLTGENEWTGDVMNPYDDKRQSGGSSSGSAVAVAVGIGLGSLGTDTGGSIRVPAALCGITGFKPTHGLVPLDGALPLSPTCDHAGPLARNVADARLLAEVLIGHNLPSVQLGIPRFGVPTSYLEGRLTREMREAFEATLDKFRCAGALVTSVKVPDLALTLQAYTPLVRAEAAHVHRHALAYSPEGFSEPVRKALEAGANMMASSYLQARQQRRHVIEGLRHAFDLGQVDALILPTTPGPALRRGEIMIALEAGLTLHRDAQLALTAPFSMAGVPVAAIPSGRLDGLPIGLQLVTRWGEDALALNLSGWAEQLLAEAELAGPPALSFRSE